MGMLNPSKHDISAPAAATRAKGRRLVFCLSYTHDLRELEWCMPYIAGFAKRGYDVDVLLPCEARSERMRLLTDWTATYACCRVLEDFDPLGQGHRVLSRLAQGKGTFGKLARIYTEIGHPKGRLLGLQAWRWQHLFRNIGEWLAGAEACFLTCHPFHAEPGSASLLTYQPALDSGLPIIWLPHGIGDLYDTVFVSKGPQLHLAHSDKDDRFYRECGMRSVPVGAPRFDADWLKETQAFFETRGSGTDALPQGRKTVLLITKNETSPVWHGVDFVGETTRFIKRHADLGRFMVVKPHPGQDLNLLASILAQFPADSYIIDQRPLAYWVQKVDFCAAQLSSGVLDAVAVGLKFDVEHIDKDGINTTDDDAATARRFVSTHLDTWAGTPADGSGSETSFHVKFRRDIPWNAALDACETMFTSRTTGRIEARVPA